MQLREENGLCFKEQNNKIRNIKSIKFTSLVKNLKGFFFEKKKKSIKNNK